MDPKSDLIREDIDETRSSLTEKLESLEGQLRDTVESAKQSVEGTIENVKDSVRQLSPSFQTRRHPWIMVGGAMATGVLAGRWVKSSKAMAAENADLGQTPIEIREPQLATSAYEHVEYSKPVNHSTSAAHHKGSRLLSRLSHQFEDEIGMVKGMILTGVLTAAGEWAKQSAPRWRSQIDQVVGSAVNKLTTEA